MSFLFGFCVAKLTRKNIFPMHNEKGQAIARIRKLTKNKSSPDKEKCQPKATTQNEEENLS